MSTKDGTSWKRCCWEEKDWLQSLETAHRQLASYEYCDVAPPRTNTRKTPNMAIRWINMAEIGCKLIDDVRDARVHLPKGFKRSIVDPNGADQEPKYLPPPSHKYKSPYSKTRNGKPLKNLEEVRKWIRKHRPRDSEETRECGDLEFECQLTIPTRERILELLDMCTENDYPLRKTLLGKVRILSDCQKKCGPQ